MYKYVCETVYRKLNVVLGHIPQATFSWVVRIVVGFRREMSRAHKTIPHIVDRHSFKIRSSGQNNPFSTPERVKKYAC